MKKVIAGFLTLHRGMALADAVAVPTPADPHVGRESATERRTSTVRRAAWAIAAAIFILTVPNAPLFAQQITEIIGAPYEEGLSEPSAVAVDNAGNVYVSGFGSDNAFKIAPDGAITEIIDSAGDGTNGLDGPAGIAVDSDGNVYITGTGSHNVFKIAPAGTITQIIDSTGDGTNGLYGPAPVAVDNTDNVYVAGLDGQGVGIVLKITPAGTITQIIDSTGDGTNSLGFPRAIAVDSAENVYVSGFYFGEPPFPYSVVKITPGGAITQIINSWGPDGPFYYLGGLAVDSAANVYVAQESGHSVLKIAPDGTITREFIGDEMGPLDVAVDSTDNVYVSGSYFGEPPPGSVFKITPGGTITQIIDYTGNGTSVLYYPGGLAVDSAGNVYVAGRDSNNVFKIALGEAPPPLCDGDCNGDGVITVDEVITGVNIALGNVSVCECMPCDTDDNGVISIEELIRAVHQALTGCPFWNAEGGDLQGSATTRAAEMREQCEEREEAVR